RRRAGATAAELGSPAGAAAIRAGGARPRRADPRRTGRRRGCSGRCAGCARGDGGGRGGDGGAGTGMAGSVGVTAYRAAMRVVAATAALAGRVPGLPAGWRSVEDRLGRLAPSDRVALSRGPVLWMHAASVGELRAMRPLLAALRSRRPGRVV